MCVVIIIIIIILHLCNKYMFLLYITAVWLELVLCIVKHHELLKSQYILYQLCVDSKG